MPPQTDVKNVRREGAFYTRSQSNLMYNAPPSGGGILHKGQNVGIGGGFYIIANLGTKRLTAETDSNYSCSKLFQAKKGIFLQAFDPKDTIFGKHF